MPPKLQPCSSCSGRFKSRALLEEHLKTCQAPQENPQMLPLDPIEEPEQKEAVGVPDPMESTQQPPDLHVCQLCGKKMPDSKSLKKHTSQCRKNVEKRKSQSGDNLGPPSKKPSMDVHVAAPSTDATPTSPTTSDAENSSAKKTEEPAAAEDVKKTAQPVVQDSTVESASSKKPSSEELIACTLCRALRTEEEMKDHKPYCEFNAAFWKEYDARKWH